jgi:hypothetical protein
MKQCNFERLSSVLKLQQVLKSEERKKNRSRKSRESDALRQKNRKFSEMKKSELASNELFRKKYQKNLIQLYIWEWSVTGNFS